ncbi:hypothetical protein NDU88_003080 [Pleurodeles waltl]|uniref:Uncharacterized protein n=1 Tax=Pleurodeles waltl TaxID=8319 RepID=A0AAV7PB43_PLEWA|nr:hypothetical protein NDU88_003080 [Pleurodeles waltl]
MHQLFTTPPGAKWQPETVMPQRSLGLVVQGPPGSVELFPWSGNAATFHHTSRCKMAAGGSNAAKEPEACGSGPPRQRRVRPVKRECSDLFTAQDSAKSQTAALLPQRSLGLVVRAPPGSVEFVLQSGNAASFSLHFRAQNTNRGLQCCKGVWGFWFRPPEAV